MGRILQLVALSLQRDDVALLDWLGATLARRIGVLPIEGAPLRLDPAWLDPARAQYDSNLVIDRLVETGATDPPPDSPWTLAVTSADLFAPGREFVFGEATLGGFCALVSLARLGGDPSTQDVQLGLRDRLLKESIHELGHLAGIDHCEKAGCAMASSAAIADIDRKPAALCDGCRALLEAAVKSP